MDLPTLTLTKTNGLRYAVSHVAYCYMDGGKIGLACWCSGQIMQVPIDEVKSLEVERPYVPAG